MTFYDMASRGICLPGRSGCFFPHHAPMQRHHLGEQNTQGVYIRSLTVGVSFPDFRRPEILVPVVNPFVKLRVDELGFAQGFRVLPLRSTDKPSGHQYVPD